ncbi:MAG: hypothetical protein L6R37_008353, partial [Teloschistes peruensis]
MGSDSINIHGDDCTLLHHLHHILVHHLPRPSSEEAAKIAACLLPDLGLDPHSSRALQEFGYASIIDGIKAYLESPDPRDAFPGDGSDFPDSIEAFEEPDGRLEAWELFSALKVLRAIRAKEMVPDSAGFPKIIATVEEMLSLQKHGEAPTPPQLARGISKKCYICRFVINQPHKSYPFMCQPCGAFNLAETSLSLPANLDLPGRTAFITGGRVNLGFHTALRLLRCGASIIVSSRYPQDVELRYLRQSDSEAWVSRLKIVGADFRRAKDVFSLVRSIAYILHNWKSDNLGSPNRRLNILINNAAQTLTDPVCAEEKAIQREGALPRMTDSLALIVHNDYEATVSGGSRLLGGFIELDKTLNSASMTSYTSLKTEKSAADVSSSSHQTIRGDGRALMLQPEKSSWVQTLQEIPYEDLICAHSVDTFVPLILIRELLPFMARSASNDPAHIINVSGLILAATVLGRTWVATATIGARHDGERSGEEK